MRIVQVTPFFYPVVGGMETHVQKLSLELMKLGHEVLIVTTNRDRNGTRLKTHECINGILIYRCPVQLKLTEFSSLSFQTLLAISQLDYDVVHAHSFRHLHCDFSALSAKILKRTSILTTHAPFFYDHIRSGISRIMTRLYDRLLARRSFSWFNKIIALTNGEISWLKSYGVPNSKIAVIPNGIDPHSFEVIKENDFRLKQGIDGPMILSISRLHWSKGIQFTLRILPQLVKEFPDLIFAVVGPDSGYLNQLRSMASTLGVSEHVIFTGYLSNEEKRKAIAATDVFVLSSRCEGFGLVILEAWAQRKPIVATRSGGPDHIITDGHNGFLVDYMNIPQLRSRVALLLRKQELAREFGKRGRVEAEKHTWDRVAKMVESVYISKE